MDDPLEIEDSEDETTLNGSGNAVKFTPPDTLSDPSSMYDAPYAPLPVPGKFLDVVDIFRILDNPSKILAAIPKGHKANMFFLVYNMEKWESDKISPRFDKEGGIWDFNKHASNSSYFVFRDGGKPVNVKVVDGRYYTRNLPMVPQPDKSSVAKLTRFYYHAKDDENHRRRVSLVSGMCYDETIALFEYCGPKVTKDQTRKRKVSDQHLDVENLKSAKVQAVMEVSKAPHKVKQVINSSKVTLKVAHTPEVMVGKRKSPECDPRTHTTNPPQMDPLSSEQWDLMHLLGEDRSIQSVISRKSGRPCVVLYNKEQLNDMIRNVECGENLIGLDCSRWIGGFHLTMTVYQNCQALNKTTYEPLLFFGPMLVHLDHDFMTYAHFLSHLIPGLKDARPNFEVRLGERTDETLFRALRRSFPKSDCILNHHHLKGTVRARVRKECGGRNKCNDVANMVFGPCGLASSTSKDEYERKMATFKPYIGVLPQGFREYFTNLEPLLYPYICEPALKGMVPKLWQGGNDEFLEANIGRTVMSKPKTLTALLERLNGLIRNQLSIGGCGN